MESRRRRGRDVDLSEEMSRGDAAAATRIVRGDESRGRRGREVAERGGPTDRRRASSGPRRRRGRPVATPRVPILLEHLQAPTRRASGRPATSPSAAVQRIVAGRRAGRGGVAAGPRRRRASRFRLRDRGAPSDPRRRRDRPAATRGGFAGLAATPHSAGCDAARPFSGGPFRAIRTSLPGSSGFERANASRSRRGAAAAAARRSAIISTRRRTRAAVLTC